MQFFVVKLGGLTTRDAFRNSLEMMQQSARLMRSFTPNGFLCDWQEMDDKIESFSLFQWADRELGIPAGATAQQVLSYLPKEDTFHWLWVREGVGHLAGMAASLSGQGLLTEGDAARIPDTALVPLHAGMGTAFAERVFEGLPSNPSKPDIDRAVRRFIDVCVANCRPGWEDGTMEPLGLVIRCLYPQLLGPVGAALNAINPALRVLFWHGVGRGLYFVPTNFLPYATARKRMIESAMTETQDPDERRNVLAGMIWAVTLVNLCHPRILKALAQVCAELKLYDEFRNGMISAVLVWRHMAPADVAWIDAYTSRDKDRSGDGLMWSHWVMTPAREALEDVYPGLERQNRMAALYTYRTPEELLRLSATAVGNPV